jgi:hypothetical protein
MSSSATYKLQIKCADAQEFTLNSVIGAPRTCTPFNLAAACKNVLVESSAPEAPFLVSACTQYLLTEFFSLAHRTGLYNRQRPLWEALARITEVEAHRLRQGFFQKVDLPSLDLYGKDGRDRVILLANVAEDEALGGDDRKPIEYLKGLLGRAEKLKNSRGLSGGIILFCPRPFPDAIVNNIIKQTSGNDPVARYESLLGEPLAMSIDLVEFELEEDGNRSAVQFRLVHPPLPVGARAKEKP